MWCDHREAYDTVAAIKKFTDEQRRQSVWWGPGWGEGACVAAAWSSLTLASWLGRQPARDVGDDWAELRDGYEASLRTPMQVGCAPGEGRGIKGKYEGVAGGLELLELHG